MADTGNQHPFKYEVGDVLAVKSGKLYRILCLRGDDHPKLKGELGYAAVQVRNGVAYGPSRLMRESAFA